jgi:tetratricopeptide (TPR) repeat protein
MDWVKIFCHCGEELDVLKTNSGSNSSPCPQCGCSYALNVNDNRMRYQIGNNFDCENPTDHDTKDIFKNYYQDLLIRAIMLSMKGKRAEAVKIYEKLLKINQLSLDEEFSCRQHYAKDLLALSFEDNADFLNLRKEAIRQVEKAIELCDAESNASILSELYDLLGDALLVYSDIVKNDEQKFDNYIVEAAKAYEKAVSLNPENEHAIKNFNEFKKYLPNQKSSTQTTATDWSEAFGPNQLQEIARYNIDYPGQKPIKVGEHALCCLRCKNIKPIENCNNCGSPHYQFGFSTGRSLGLFCSSCNKGYTSWACPACNTDNPISHRTIYHKRKGGCFIATAVYGSYSAPEVIVLRRFRDEVLHQSAPGRLFESGYYFISPRIAKMILFFGISDFLRKHFLNPLVGAVRRLS